MLVSLHVAMKRALIARDYPLCVRAVLSVTHLERVVQILSLSVPPRLHQKVILLSIYTLFHELTTEDTYTFLLYNFLCAEFLVVANQDGIVRVDLSGESQTVLVRGEHHTTAVDFDIRYKSCRIHTLGIRRYVRAKKRSVYISSSVHRLSTGQMWFWAEYEDLS